MRLSVTYEAFLYADSFGVRERNPSTGLLSQASFVQTFGIEYGLFVQNNKDLTIQEINATGDGIHVLVETERGSDLIVEGTVHQQFTNTDPAGVVLIAGEPLRFV